MAQIALKLYRIGKDKMHKNEEFFFMPQGSQESLVTYQQPLNYMSSKQALGGWANTTSQRVHSLWVKKNW